MNLLRVLALLGRGDQASSEGMYEVLVDVMKRADTGINIGYAIGKYTTITIIFNNSATITVFKSTIISYRTKV